MHTHNRTPIHTYINIYTLIHLHKLIGTLTHIYTCTQTQSHANIHSQGKKDINYLVNEIGHMPQKTNSR